MQPINHKPLTFEEAYLICVKTDKMEEDPLPNMIRKLKMKNVYGILEQFRGSHPTIKRNIYKHKKDAIAACKKDGFVKDQSFMALDTWLRETTVRNIIMLDYIEEVG